MMFPAKEFKPPKVENSLLSFGTRDSQDMVTGYQLPVFNRKFEFSHYEPIVSPFVTQSQQIFQDQAEETPVGRASSEYSVKPRDSGSIRALRNSNSVSHGRDVVPAVKETRKPRGGSATQSWTQTRHHPELVPSQYCEYQNQCDSSFEEYNQTISDLTTALSKAVSDKANLMEENAVLQERISAYEQRMGVMNSQFQQMMSRISALESSQQQHSGPPEASSFEGNSTTGRRGSVATMVSEAPSYRRPVPSSAVDRSSSNDGRVNLRTYEKRLNTPVSVVAPPNVRSLSVPKSRADPAQLSARSTTSSVNRRSNSAPRTSRSIGNNSGVTNQSGQPSRSAAVVARNRLMSNSRAGNGEARNTLLTTPSQPPTNIVHVKRAMSPHKVTGAQRSHSPYKTATAKTTSTQPVGIPSDLATMKASTNGQIQYSIEIHLQDQLMASCALENGSSPIKAEGPFLYILQSVRLNPVVTFTPSNASTNPFAGLSITITGTNSQTGKSNSVFKSHSSHIMAPPVTDSYFTHSCWLSGPGASVVGGVRMYYSKLSERSPGITLQKVSLKYWFPSGAEHETGGASVFTKDHWNNLLKLLGILD